MKPLLKILPLLLCAAAIPSHALIGFGIHLAPAYGPEVKKAGGSIMPAGSANEDRILLLTGGVSGLQGVGAKVWIDFLPLIDLEGTTNVQFGYYDMAFAVDQSLGGTGPYDTTEVKPDFSIPFTQNKPVYARVSGDAAALYPFLDIPVLKVYAGAGLSYVAATPVLNNSFAKAAITRADEEGSFDAETADADDIADVLQDALKDEGLSKGIGFFLQAGARIKPPVIPLAVYANAKYGFGGPKVAGVSGGPGLTLELGGGIAF